MKKILLSLMLLYAFTIVKAQSVVLNEIYGNPGGSNSEFVELYNSGGAGTLDCYSMLIYFENEGGTNKGWYLLDLPSTPPVNSTPGFYVLASNTTFSVQGSSGAAADVNWNNLAFRSGTTDGFLKKFIYDGSGSYTDAGLADNTTVSNLLDGTLNGGQIYIVLLYKNGGLINGFVGGGASGNIPTLLGNLGSYNFPTNCGGSMSTFPVNFASLAAVEFFNPSGGNDNGYARSSDGKCGSWVKTAPQVNHTPGNSNGIATGLAGALDVSILFRCGDIATDPHLRLEVSISSFSGDVNLTDDFPVTVELVYDNNGDEIINEGDVVHPTTKTLSNTGIVDTFHLIQNPGQLSWDFIVTFRTKRGCFDRVIAFSQSCATLPIKMTSFVAARNRNNVNLTWTTSIEEDNKGFEVQRKVGFANWETLGFVETKAVNGISYSNLSYDFADFNDTKGVTQYRLKQIDINGAHSYSLIRSVRGEGQKGKTIVYPNPSSDGKVNIIFDDIKGVRDVSVTDMSGRMIKQMKAVTNNNIQIDNLNAGMYMVRILNTETGEQVVEKFVVNKR